MAWRYGGEDPYCLYNGLDRDYRPLGHPLEEPRPPVHPHRLTLFKFALGAYAELHEKKLQAGRG